MDKKIECKYFVKKNFFKRGKILINECIKETVTQEYYDKMWQHICDADLSEQYSVHHYSKWGRDYFEITKNYPGAFSKYDSVNIIVFKLSEV